MCSQQPTTLTTNREACRVSSPNSDKYLDDKAEHDTPSTEVLLTSTNRIITSDWITRPALLTLNDQEHARAGSEPLPTTEKLFNIKNAPGIWEAKVFHHLHKPDSLTDEQGRPPDSRTAASQQNEVRAGTTEVPKKILAAGMPHEEGLRELMPKLLMQQMANRRCPDSTSRRPPSCPSSRPPK